MLRISRIILPILALIILLISCSVSPTLAPTTSLSTSPAIRDTALPLSTSAWIQESSPNIPVPSQTETVKVWIDPQLPFELSHLLRSNIENYGTSELTSDANAASIRLSSSDQNRLGSWVYALVAPFPTVIDGVTLEDILSMWRGVSSPSNPNQIMLMEESTYKIFKNFWGENNTDSVKILPQEDLIDYAWKNRPAWALIPFEELDPRWKVLEVEGQSPIHKDFNPNNYPLIIPIGYTGSDVSFLKSGIESINLPISNWHADNLTTLSLTGVTALVRGTALTMERKGITYPALDIGEILLNSDLTHINNEVPFALDCPFPELNTTSLVFCSNQKYIGLLDEVGTDIIELSGDHFADQGPDAMLLTLDMYAQRGWQVYGGGANEMQARQPILIDHNGNHIAMLGCNIGCVIKNEISCRALALGDQPGAATCDFEWLDEEIKQLTDQGYNVVFTFQHKEYYSYTPQPDLIRDFRRVAQAGAKIVSGSQAHQPHTFAIEDGTFIHYGLGNLFFDQYNYCVDYACNDGFIDRHVFYNNHHISTELITIRFVDMARPRLMTPEERVDFLNLIFKFSGW